jgi:hypothetical protein
MSEKLSTTEHLLFNAVQRLAKQPQGWRAVVIHLSRLRADNRRGHHIRIAVNTFESLVKQFDGQLYALAQGDVCFLARDADVAALDNAVMKVRYLFGDDPLGDDLDGISGDAFATWYDLRNDFKRFYAFAEAVYEDQRQRQRRLSAIAGERAEVPRTPMEPQALSELERSIARADLSNLLRRQAVCAVTGDEPPKPIFREVYVSIADLRDAVMPAYDIASDPWLFRHLTQILDKRVLAQLRRNDDSALTHSYSLNLNVSTLLSPDFLAFDANLRTGARGSIIIEIEKVDIFADIGAYIFAREFARERGYRLCLDGVTAMTLPFIDRERLGLDLVKLFWSPDMADRPDGDRARELQAALERTGRSRVVLARCDGPEAVAFGQSVGIRLFQGRHLDKLTSVANTPLAQKLVPPARRAGR